MNKQLTKTTKHGVLLVGLLSAVLVVGALGFNSTQTGAESTTVYSSDFESDTAGWAGNGSVTRVESGSNGVQSAGGDYHALVSGSHVGPNNQLGGYSSQWPGEWAASIDLYLDPSWPAGTGFIYSVATNNSSGTSLRDFMLNAGVLNDESTDNTNKFVVLADTAGTSTSDPLYHIKAMPVERRGEITQAGWYTFTHQFKNIDGRLVVVMDLSTKSGTPIKSWTIDYAWVNDQIPGTVGGNRYAWFTHADVPGGIAIDNVTRSITQNQFTVSDNATEPVSIELHDNQTVQIDSTLNGTAVTPVEIEIKSASNGSSIVIPEGTTINAESSSWNGTILAPSPEDSVNSIDIDGQSIPVSSAYKFGSDTPLQFSKPVRIVLPGQAGKNAGHLDASGSFHAITTECQSGPSGVISESIQECFTNEGDDLVIWTTHFSVFLSYEYDGSGSDIVGAPNTGLSPTSLGTAGIALTAGLVGVVTLALSARRRTHAVTQKK